MGKRKDERIRFLVENKGRQKTRYNTKQGLRGIKKRGRKMKRRRALRKRKMLERSRVTLCEIAEPPSNNLKAELLGVSN